MRQLRGSKIKPTKYNISQLLARKIVSMETLYEKHSSKTFVTFINKSYGDT